MNSYENQDDKRAIYNEHKDLYGLYSRGFKQYEIAIMLGISKGEVSKRLAWLRDNYPMLFGTTPEPGQPVSYDPEKHDGHVKEQF